MVKLHDPMDLAYRLLKRQTELGEYHDDFPSSHGPVTGYRAVSDEQYKKLPYEGLTGTPITTHLEGIGRIRDNPPKKGIYAWMGHTPTGLDFAREKAQDWANEMSNNRDTPSRVVGIRGSHDLSHMDDYANDWYGVKEDDHDHAAAHIIPHDIPPEQIVRMLKARQTKLYNWIPDYPGKEPVQQLSAQPQQYMENYLEGEYPDEFWSFIGDNPEDTEGHGASRHRSDDDGNYLAVGVRGQSPIGDAPTRGPFRNIKDGGGVRVVGKDDMPDPDDIVVMPKNAAHMPQFDPKQKGEFRKPKPKPSKRKYVRISQ